MKKQKNSIIAIILTLWIIGISYSCFSDKKDEKSHESPSFKFAKIGMSEAEVIKNAGKPTIVITDTKRIIEDLIDDRNRLNEFIVNFKKSNDGRIEQELEVLNSVLKDNPQDKNLKKVIYTITQTDDNGYTSEYQKRIYYLDDKLIEF